MFLCEWWWPLPPQCYMALTSNIWEHFHRLWFEREVTLRRWLYYIVFYGYLTSVRPELGVTWGEIAYSNNKGLFVHISYNHASRCWKGYWWTASSEVYNVVSSPPPTPCWFRPIRLTLACVLPSHLFYMLYCGGRSRQFFTPAMAALFITRSSRALIGCNPAPMAMCNLVVRPTKTNSSNKQQTRPDSNELISF